MGSGLFQVASAQEFRDLNSLNRHGSEDAVHQAGRSGCIKGYKDATFRPDNPATRTEFVTMLNRALGLKDDNKVILNFIDVNSDDWFAAKAQAFG